MRMIKHLLTLAIVLACGAALAEDKVAHVKAAEAAKLVEAGKVLVLDVRTPDEFSEGHIKGAVNVDFNGDDFASKVAKLDKSKPVLVHCQAGGRSTRSLPALEKAGFLKIYHLDGGFGDWQDAGLPTAK